MDFPLILRYVVVPMLSPLVAVLIFVYSTWKFLKNERKKIELHEKQNKLSKEQCVHRDAVLLGAYTHILACSFPNVTQTQFDYFKELFLQCYRGVLDNPQVFRNYICQTSDVESDKYPPFVLLLLSVNEKLRDAPPDFFKDPHVLCVVYTLLYLFETDDAEIESYKNHLRTLYKAHPYIEELFKISRIDGK